MLAQLNDIPAFPFIILCYSLLDVVVCGNILEFGNPLIWILYLCNNHAVWVAIDRRSGMKITTISTCCKILISQQILTRIKRLVLVSTSHGSWHHYGLLHGRNLFSASVCMLRGTLVSYHHLHHHHHHYYYHYYNVSWRSRGTLFLNLWDKSHPPWLYLKNHPMKYFQGSFLLVFPRTGYILVTSDIYI